MKPTKRSGLLAGVMLAGIALLRPLAPTEAAPIGQIDENLIVVITNPQPGQRLEGRVEITGYAADPRSARGAGVNPRDIRLYLDDVSDERYLLAFAEAGRDSPEAIAALGPRIDNAGFRALWETCSFPAGPYKLMVWVSSLTTPGARQGASVDVDVAPCNPPGNRIGFTNSDQVFTNTQSQLNTAFSRTLNLGAAPGAPRVFADFAAGIDAWCVETDEGCAVRLVFRRTPGPGDNFSDAWYGFQLYPAEGRYSVVYSPFASGAERDDTRIRTLVPRTASPAIRRGTAHNRLAVIAEGNALQFFVNGEQVGETRDASRSWGALGWAVVNTGVERAVTAQFDRMVVTTVGPLETLDAVLRGPTP